MTHYIEHREKAVAMLNAFTDKHHGPLLASVLIHALILALLLINGQWFKSPPAMPVYKVIEAVAVDARVLKPVEKPVIKPKAPDQKTLQKEKQRAQEREALRIQQQKAAEQKKKEDERKRAEQKRLQEEQAAAEKKRLEQERLAKERAEQKRIEQEQAEAKQREQELKDAIAREENFQQQDALRSDYILAIDRKISRNWIEPSRTGEDDYCEIKVSQIPGGEIVSVEVTFCNGSTLLQRSVENAVHKASPLPYDSFESVFERTLILEFRPKRKTP